MRPRGIRKINIGFLFIILFTKTLSLYGQSPLQFIENKNQWQPDILFRADIPDGTMFFERDRLTFNFTEAGVTEYFHCMHGEKPKKINHHAISVRFINANKSPLVTGEDKYQNYYNYFLGNDRRRWASNVKAYKKVHYQNIYPGIHFEYFSSGNNLKYDVIIKPYADPGNIELEFEGCEAIWLKKGVLHIKTSLNELTELLPVAYQIINNVRKEIKCSYQLKNDRIRFSFPEGYNRNNDLIIDPVLVFSSFSGSYANNFGYTASFDSKGFLYAGGSVFQTSELGGYPVTTGAYQTEWAGIHTDMGLSKYDTTGHNLIYSTYLGGTKADLPHSLYVNDNYELYILGTTGSFDFPTSADAYDNSFNGGPYTTTFGYGIAFQYGIDMVISRLSSDGTALLSSTYLGGSSNDGFNSAPALKYNYGDEFRGDIFVDGANNCYIVSCSASTDFPTTSGSFQPNYGGNLQDAVIAKFDGALHSLLWSSFLGGTGDDAAYSFALASNHKVYISGGTSSADFPTTTGAVQPLPIGQTDAFVTCISDNGQYILYSTYYGCDKYDQAYFVQTDNQNYPYIFGQTKASGINLVQNVLFYQENSGQFITKLSPDLHSVMFSTVFGTGLGHIDISPTAFLVDNCKHIYISGWGGHVNDTVYGGHGGNTYGLTVTNDAYQSTTTDSSDFYLMVLEENADSMIYATFFGGPVSDEHVDGGTSRFSKKGMVYQSVCAGCGGNSDFPTTTGAWSSTNNSNCNNAVFKFDFELPQTVADFDMPPIGCYPVIINFDNNSYDATTYSWLVNSTPLSNTVDFSHNFTSPGTYEITLIANNPLSCNQTDTITKVIQIGSNSTQYLSNLNVCNNDSIQVGFPGNEDPSVFYNWSPPGYVSDPAISNPDAAPQGGNVNLMLTVTQYSCTDTFYQNIISNILNADASDDFSICENTASSVYATSSGTPCTYAWSVTTSFENPFSTDSMITVNPGDTTTYYCLVQTNYCTDTVQVTLSVSHVDIQAEPLTTICNGDSVQLNVVSNIPGNNHLFTWWPDSVIFPGDEHSQSPFITITDTTLFFVTLTDTVLGCTDTDSILVSVSDFSVSTYDLIVPLYDTIYQYQSTQINTVSENVFGYLWIPESGLNDPHCANPVASPLITTTYIVHVTDSFGCERTDSITIFVVDVLCNEVYVFVPNAFTPNSDNMNDVLYVQSYLVKDLYFVIFDRWGEKVFETTDISNGWDGTFRGELLDPAVFVYYLKATCLNNAVFEKRGNVTLLR